MEIDYEKTIDFEDLFYIDVDLYDLRVWADDIEEIRQILKTINIHTSHLVCYSFWASYSAKMDAGWMGFVRSEVIREANNFIRGVYRC